MKNKISPIARITPYSKTEELGRLLGKKGTTDILHQLEERPKKYTELEENTKLSHTSFLRRLTILQIIGIVKKFPIRSKQRGTHEYGLTHIGLELMKFIHSYEKIMTLPPSQQKIIDD